MSLSESVFSVIDVLATLRTHLLAQAPLLSLVSTRIYAGVTFPPSAYIPGQAALTFNSRGGTPSFDGRILSESFTFKCYGAGDTGAMATYRTLADVLHESHGVNIRHAELEVAGTLLYEEEPVNWPFVLTFFRVVFNSQLGV